jgi:hypothetical protein
MAEKIQDWKTTCERYVAFLDIMGFRERVFRDSHKQVKNMFESLYPTIALFKDLAKKKLGRKTIDNDLDKEYASFFPSAVFPVTFSDSIILVSNGGSLGSANSVLLYVELILYRAITRGIPLKGAIAYGKMTADLEKSIYFGKPLIDAYELQNELQLYGVVMHNTMEKHLQTSHNARLLNNGFVFQYPVPMKSGKITHYIVDWAPERKEDTTNLSSVLYNTVSGSPRIYVDNTLEFLRWLKKRKAMLARQKKSPSRPSIKSKKS